jgi:hypothetical protein
MNIDKVMNKLDDFFNQSASKQKKKHDKLLAIIEKLERKKAELKTEMIIESEKDETSDVFHDMDKELKVISKLLKKAKQHSTPEQETPDE